MSKLFRLFNLLSISILLLMMGCSEDDPLPLPTLDFITDPEIVEVGVPVTFNSDSGELARHLNTEATKAVKYGDVDPHEALKFVTYNAALQLGVEDKVGSLQNGLDADFVIWNGDPLATTSRPDKPLPGAGSIRASPKPVPNPLSSHSLTLSSIPNTSR